MRIRSTESLKSSLERQKRLLKASILLNPVENIPLHLHLESVTGFTQGLYVTDKLRDENGQRISKILFGGRSRAIKDSRSICGMWANAFGGECGSMRLLSGLHAHTLVFMCLGNIGDKALILPEEAGGHFSTKAILERLGFKVVEADIDYQNLCVDQEKTLELIQTEAPQFIFIDRSEGLWFENFSSILNDCPGYKIFDISHYVPQILLGKYPNPLKIGCDLILFTLHKSFPGPQKAMVISNSSNKMWSRLVDGLGKFVSNLHVANTYLAGFALMDADKLRVYTERLIQNTHALERELLKRGIPVVDRRQYRNDWPITHHIWITPKKGEDGYNLFKHLEQARIHVNYRLLPYKQGFGLRLGTAGATMQGLTPHLCENLADQIQQVFSRGYHISIRHKVRELAESMQQTALIRFEDNFLVKS